LICEIPSAGAPLLADTDLKSVDRILVSCGDDQFGLSENAEIRAVLSDRGYDVEETGNALTFTRAKEAATGTDPAAKKTTATAS
jgi:hypothetical protein